MVNSSNRDYRFDNLKGVLIFLVVFTHTLELHSGYKTDALIGSLYAVIYSFHMAVFVFISGYFTKPIQDGEKWGKKTISATLIPFLVFNFIYWLIKSRHVTAFLTPQFAMWYLLSLFFWRLLVIPVSQIKYSLAFAIVASLYIGITSANKFLSIHRTISFFPYFLAGYLVHKKTSEEGERSIVLPKPIPYIALLLTVAVPILLLALFQIRPSIYTMSLPYADIGLGKMKGVLLRVVALLLGFCGIGWTISFSPNKKTFLSTLGKRSLLIYVLHPIIIRAWRALDAPVFTQPLPMIGLAFAVAAIACVLFGNRYVEKCYDFCFGKINALLLK